MTVARYFAILFFQIAVFILLKLFFFNITGLQSAFYFYLYLFAIFLFSLALSRRLGVINYLEAMFTCVMWFFFNFLADLVFTSNFLGTTIFRQKELWLGYLIMVTAVLFFHKKRHIQIRKELKARHH